MTWAPLLLADPSPCLRALVLRDLLARPLDDPEYGELLSLRERDPLVADLVSRQQPDGSWGRDQVVGGDTAGRGPAGQLRATALALLRLSYLGLPADHSVVLRGVERLFAWQRDDGSWPLPADWDDHEERKGYTMIPLQTALPLRAASACGRATDPRAERAYAWLLAQRLPDGAWPTGINAGNFGGVAGYRRLAHSRWGCRTNTTAALICLALHPERRHGSSARMALDLLLGRETHERHTLGFEIARQVGAEPARGVFTFHARYDVALTLDLCGRVGATLDDERVAQALRFVRDAQGPYGLWEYLPHPEASRWVTFDLLRSLARLDAEGEWVSMEPRTPFRAYQRAQPRF